MKFFKLFIGVLFLIFVSACAELSRISDYVNDNPVVVSIAVRQGVVRYIEVAETQEAKEARAIDARIVLENVKAMLNSENTTSVARFLEFVNKSIDWDRMSLSDKIIVQDLLSVAYLSISNSSDDISPQTKITVSGVIDSAITATKLF